ncbi:hypothetical protein BDZ89DRAFT_1113036 [Hymenopellis radicata]|nr:hypothetical protein BDZ89DRAFT_1113036 [Hymenopellis radicata]
MRHNCVAKGIPYPSQGPLIISHQYLISSLKKSIIGYGGAANVQRDLERKKAEFSLRHGEQPKPKDSSRPPPATPTAPHPPTPTPPPNGQNIFGARDEDMDEDFSTPVLTSARPLIRMNLESKAMTLVARPTDVVLQEMDIAFAKMIAESSSSLFLMMFRGGDVLTNEKEVREDVQRTLAEALPGVDCTDVRVGPARTNPIPSLAYPKYPSAGQGPVSLVATGVPPRLMAEMTERRIWAMSTTVAFIAFSGPEVYRLRSSFIGFLTCESSNAVIYSSEKNRQDYKWIVESSLKAHQPWRNAVAISYSHLGTPTIHEREIVGWEVHMTTSARASYEAAKSWVDAARTARFVGPRNDASTYKLKSKFFCITCKDISHDKKECTWFGVDGYDGPNHLTKYGPQPAMKPRGDTRYTKDVYWLLVLCHNPTTWFPCFPLLLFLLNSLLEQHTQRIGNGSNSSTLRGVSGLTVDRRIDEEGGLNRDSAASRRAAPTAPVASGTGTSGLGPRESNDSANDDVVSNPDEREPPVPQRESSIRPQTQESDAHSDAGRLETSTSPTRVRLATRDESGEDGRGVREVVMGNGGGGGGGCGVDTSSHIIRPLTSSSSSSSCCILLLLLLIAVHLGRRVIAIIVEYCPLAGAYASRPRFHEDDVKSVSIYMDADLESSAGVVVAGLKSSSRSATGAEPAAAGPAQSQSQIHTPQAA